MQPNYSLPNPSATVPRVFTFVLLLLFLSSSPPLQAEWSLLDGAKVHPDYHGPVPKKSDVIFSTRFKRDNAVEVARSFSATRIEWVYSTDSEFVRSLQLVAPWFGGTLSSTMPLPKDEGIARDFDGNPIVAPWMKSWGAKWITTTDPRTREILQGIARQYLNLGASSIQIDDPLLQLRCADWGGDFSESSIAGFREFLATYPDQAELERVGIRNPQEFDYKQFLFTSHNIRTAKEYGDRYHGLPTTSLWLRFLKESVISHYRSFRRYVDEAKGSVVPLSMNLALYGPDESKTEFILAPFADYAIVETRIHDLDLVSLQAATYRALGIGYVPSIVPRTKAENRAAIATLYAMGAQPLVPWDVYINNGSDNKPTRFFGSPEDYGDLYRFVRDHAALFDDYDQVAEVGILVPVDHYLIKATAALVRRLLRENIPYALVPIGGRTTRYFIDPVRATHFRVLLTTNPLSDFTPEDLKLVRTLPAELRSAENVTDEMLTTLSPYANSGSDRSRLFPRGTSNGERIVLHIIRSRDAGGPPSRQCQKAFEFKSGFFPISVGRPLAWHTPKGSQRLTARDADGRVSIELPDCEQWGMLEISLGQ